MKHNLFHPGLVSMLMKTVDHVKECMHDNQLLSDSYSAVFLPEQAAYVPLPPFPTLFYMNPAKGTREAGCR